MSWQPMHCVKHVIVFVFLCFRVFCIRETPIDMRTSAQCQTSDCVKQTHAHCTLYSVQLKYLGLIHLLSWQPAHCVKYMIVSNKLKYSSYTEVSYPWDKEEDWDQVFFHKKKIYLVKLKTPYLIRKGALFQLHVAANEAFSPLNNQSTALVRSPVKYKHKHARTHVRVHPRALDTLMPFYIFGQCSSTQVSADQY